MRLLLDTNVLSESIRSRPNPKVVDWFSSQLNEELAISLITLAELGDGISTARNEARQKMLQKWLSDEIEAAFQGRTLPLSLDILLNWIKLSRKFRLSGKPRNPSDMLLAATARVHNLTIVTRNVRDFADTGIVVYDPWHDRTHRMGPP